MSAADELGGGGQGAEEGAEVQRGNGPEGKKPRGAFSRLASSGPGLDPKWKKMKAAVTVRGLLKPASSQKWKTPRQRAEAAEVKAKAEAEEEGGAGDPLKPGGAKPGWGKMRTAVKVNGAMSNVLEQAEEEDDFLKTIKAMYDDEKQSVLGIRVGRTQQALVVKLSEDQSLKRALSGGDDGDQDGSSLCSRCAFPLINPLGPNLMTWQIFLVLMIVFNMIFVPYEIVFKECAASRPTDILNDVSDAFFMIDIIVQMHVMLVIEEKHKDRTLLVDDRSIIVKEYIRFQFWIDVLSIGPPFGSHYLKGKADSLSFVSVLKCLKLFRIAKAVKILANVIHIKADYVQIFNVVKMILLICYSSHVIGCMFSGVARMSFAEESVDEELNWVNAKGFEINPPNCENSPMKEYIAAYYWAVMTLTTVGYGDVSAQNHYEMIFSSFVMVAGAIFYALVLGSVTNAIQELSSGDQALLTKLKTVDKFITRFNLNSSMSKRLKQATRLQGEWNHEMFEDMLDACHPEFKAELLMAIHRPILIKTSFFKGIEDAFMKLVVGELKMHVCLENDCVYRVGDDGECMFLLNQGFVGVYSNELDTRIGLLEPGDVFGEGAVLSQAFSKRMETAVAEVRSVVHSLSRGAIHSAAEAFPNVKKLMEKRVVALMEQRDSVEKLLVNKERRTSDGVDGHAHEKGKDTLTVDIFQGTNLPGATDIIHANIFVRCFLFSRCSKCEDSIRRVDSSSNLLVGDSVVILKEGSNKGKHATVEETNWMNNGRVQIKMAETPHEIKSYLPTEVLLLGLADSSPHAQHGKRFSWGGEANDKQLPHEGDAKKEEHHAHHAHFPHMKLHSPLHHHHKPALASSSLLDFGVYSCANCEVVKKATATHAQTFDPEWNEKFEFPIASGKDATLFVGVYQKALSPVLLGFVKVENGQMLSGQGSTADSKAGKVDWWQLQHLASKAKLHKKGKSIAHFHKGKSTKAVVPEEVDSDSAGAGAVARIKPDDHLETVTGKLQLRVERVCVKRSHLAGSTGGGLDARSQLLDEIIHSPAVARTKMQTLSAKDHRRPSSHGVADVKAAQQSAPARVVERSLEAANRGAISARRASLTNSEFRGGLFSSMWFLALDRHSCDSHLTLFCCFQQLWLEVLRTWGVHWSRCRLQQRRM
jgi:CRP-like cAMP-binding protein